MEYLGEQQRPCWKGSLIITNLLTARDKTSTVGFQISQQTLLQVIHRKAPGLSKHWASSTSKTTGKPTSSTKVSFEPMVEWFFSYSSSRRLIPGFADTIIFNNRVWNLNTYGLTFSHLKWIEKVSMIQAMV